MSKRADMSVWEQSDSWPSFNACTNWCSGPGQYYTNSGIVHGRPGGHTLGEGYYSNYGVKAYHTSNLTTTQPTYTNSVNVHSVVRLVAKHNSYTPAYGRAGGVWGYGNGRTYTNVVQMEFSHGVGPDKTCGNTPAGYVHQPGYITFWAYIWYAEGVGEIEAVRLFDERFCDGQNVSGSGWAHYIDDDH